MNASAYSLTQTPSTAPPRLYSSARRAVLAALRTYNVPGLVETDAGEIRTTDPAILTSLIRSGHVARFVVPGTAAARVQRLTIS
jgi:hypothetical protein